MDKNKLEIRKQIIEELKDPYASKYDIRQGRCNFSHCRLVDAKKKIYFHSSLGEHYHKNYPILWQLEIKEMMKEQRQLMKEKVRQILGAPFPYVNKL